MILTIIALVLTAVSLGYLGWILIRWLRQRKATRGTHDARRTPKWQEGDLVYVPDAWISVVGGSVTQGGYGYIYASYNRFVQLVMQGGSMTTAHYNEINFVARTGTAKATRYLDWLYAGEPAGDHKAHGNIEGKNVQYLIVDNENPGVYDLWEPFETRDTAQATAQKANDKIGHVRYTVSTITTL